VSRTGRLENDTVASVGDLALERFDAAAGPYRRALEEAPEAALGCRRPGDGYTLGGLAHHVNAVLRHYGGTAEAMLAADFGEVAAPDSSRLMAEADALAGTTPTAAERDALLAETAELHESVRRQLAGVAGPDWLRTAPVRFGPGDPYPSRLVDVLGWLTDHYGEHAAQVSSLLSEWRTLEAVEAFGRAFADQDVEAVMARMTEDCVFENTMPAPDGERLTGAEAVAACWRQFFASTPSARFRTEEAFAAGDRAVVRWTFDWDEGPENRGHVRGVDLFRVSDGRVAEKLSYVKG
jgi:ketosteroid isomerase-like protein